MTIPKIEKSKQRTTSQKPNNKDVGKKVTSTFLGFDKKKYYPIIAIGILVTLSFLLLFVAKDQRRLGNLTHQLPTSSNTVLALSTYALSKDANKEPWTMYRTSGDFIDFPQNTAIVVTDVGIDFIDTSKNSLYFHCALPIPISESNKPVVLSKEGKVFVGGIGTDLYVYDFKQDTFLTLSSMGLFSHDGIKSACANESSGMLLSPTMQLLDKNIYSLAEFSKNDKQYIAVGNKTGISLFNIEDRSSWYLLDQSLDASHLAFDATGILYIAQEKLATITIIDTIFSKLQGQSQQVAVSKSSVYDTHTLFEEDTFRIATMVLQEGASSAESGKHALWVGTNKGLLLINEKAKHVLTDNFIIFAKPYTPLHGLHQFNILSGNAISDFVVNGNVTIILEDAKKNQQLQQISLVDKTISFTKMVSDVQAIEEFGQDNVLIRTSSHGVYKEKIENL
jgi:ligand-binding sensor domain-containing protein